MSRKKRQESKAYDTKGNSLGTAFYEYGLYSIGQAASTLEDLQKFAQALLGRKVLFERPETWNTLYNPTSTYPGTDIARNAHGFGSMNTESASLATAAILMVSALVSC